MRILVTGATGFVGRHLCRTLCQRGDEVVVLSRSPDDVVERFGVAAAHRWDPLVGLPPQEAWQNVDAVVHLAGESVVGRWSPAKRQAIHDSRVLGTRHLVQGMAAAGGGRALVSASAIGYYGDRGEEVLTENSSAGAAGDFLARVCAEWEAEAATARGLGGPVAIVRLGIVLGRNGGALQRMLLPARFGAGGPLGSGRQWWSWIHLRDAVGIFLHALDRRFDGPLNGTAPVSLRQRQFAGVLGEILHRPSFVAAPGFALRLVLGGFASELLASKRVVPHRTLEAGYSYRFAELAAALRELLGAGEAPPA